MREAVLSNTPCSSSVRRLPFAVVSPLSAPPPTGTDSALLRTVATNNRVLLGVLLYTRRRAPESCSNRYSKLADSCQGALDTAPFGADVAFKPGSSLFDPFGSNAADVAAVYNCSAISGATYVAPKWAAPRCQQLFGEGAQPHRRRTRPELRMRADAQCSPVHDISLRG